MKNLIAGSFLSVVLFFQGAVVFAATYKIEKLTSPAEGVSGGVGSSLQAEGFQVQDESGKVWCEVWVRKEIPGTGVTPPAGAKYQGLHTGSLLGIMRFPADGTDYRGQPIKAGAYTLRYALMPQDGNHMGAAPILDFLLLVPASEDNKDPDVELPFNDVVAMSRKATGTNHPGIILMSSPPESLQESVLEKDDMNHWILKTKVPLKPSGELAVGIIVVGQSEG
jgi:hypothetical protein